MRTVLAFSILLGLAQVAPVILAQDSDHSGKGRRHNPEERLANLSTEERQKVIAAHQTAMRDPAVQAAHEKMKQARKDFRGAMHAAMLKADPTLEPILAKLPKHEHGEHPDD